MSDAISHQTAIIYAMVLVSASDAKMTDSEFLAIGDVITHFPVFQDFSRDRLMIVAEECAAILTEAEGLDAVLGLIEEGVPDRLRETAYAAAVEVAAADEIVNQEELRILERLRSHRPASLKVCALLDKRARRLVDVPLDYIGFEIPDEFVVGYGLDYRQRYRNLPFIGVLKQEALS